MNIHFEKATGAHIDTIFSWLAEPYVMEFWDNTPEHKDDILNFVNGRKEPSNYADGKYSYWIASLNDEPFGMLMTIEETHASPINHEKLVRLSKTGHTYCLDYMIGNSSFFGKGYGAKTLAEFIDYFRANIDSKADTFLIDPESSNPRARYVYIKAGFEHVCDFIMEGEVSGEGKLHHLLIKKFDPEIAIIQAKLDDYPCIQNMARFYVYDLSRECGHISEDWRLPKNGLYESFDFKNYFVDPSRRVYLVKVYDEIAGFVLLNQETQGNYNNWNMGEFFIIAKFQGAGIATRVAHLIWEMHPETWEVSVIPENKRALIFWEKTIDVFTCGAFNKSIKKVDYDKYQPKRVIFEFDTQNHEASALPKNSERSLQRFQDEQIFTRLATTEDIDFMVSLSKAKRLDYEKAQPRFWKYAGEKGDNIQKEWFKELLQKEDYLMFVASRLGHSRADGNPHSLQIAKNVLVPVDLRLRGDNIALQSNIADEKEILGFVIGRLVPAPEVYDPGGMTLMIDDFCVRSDDLWGIAGRKLMEEVKKEAKIRKAAQILVVCGAHDTPKRKFLKNQNLSIASEWFTGNISS